MEEVILNVITNDNVISPCKLTIDEKGRFIHLKFYYKNINISASDEFPFLALDKIRLGLERSNLKLICQGSRIDVYPIGIYFYAYELELGKPAVNSVYIFDKTNMIEKIGTVEDQKSFFEKWLKSVGLSESYVNINLQDSKSTFGSYWNIINLNNWEMQSKEFQDGIKTEIKEKLIKLKKITPSEFSSIKEIFENKLNMKLDI